MAIPADRCPRRTRRTRRDRRDRPTGPSRRTGRGRRTRTAAALACSADLLGWQRDLVSQLGGYDHLEQLRSGFGGEYTDNAFDRGKVAMQLDGEWRVANLTAEKVPFQWATAPFPVPDDQAADYGRGCLSGTAIGINHNSRQQKAAWQFVSCLTTDADAVVGFANAIDNVPSTFAALDSPELQLPAAFRTFLDVAGSPYSDSAPPTADGDNYVGVLQQIGTDAEAGKDLDLGATLRAADLAIDRGLDQSTG